MNQELICTLKQCSNVSVFNLYSLRSVDFSFPASEAVVVGFDTNPPGRRKGISDSTTKTPQNLLTCLPWYGCKPFGYVVVCSLVRVRVDHLKRRLA